MPRLKLKPKTRPKLSHHQRLLSSEMAGGPDLPPSELRKLHVSDAEWREWNRRFGPAWRIQNNIGTEADFERVRDEYVDVSVPAEAPPGFERVDQA